MVITEARYIKDISGNENVGVLCKIDGNECSVPMSTGNSDYQEILRQLEAGKLTIADAD